MPLLQYPSSPASQERARPSAKFVVAIAAGKGGVGKSTLCANLALALRVKGYRVGALDADLYGPSLRQMIRADRLPFEIDGNMQPALALGIELLSMAHFRQDSPSGAFRAPIASHLIEQFLTQANWHQLDFLLIDLPPGTGDIAITLVQSGCIDTSLLISTPQRVATQDVSRCIDLFEQAQIEILGLVENMAYLEVGEEKWFPFGSGGVEELAKTRHYPLLASLPLCQQIATSADNGVPFVVEYPQHPISILFHELADRLVEAYERSRPALKPSKRGIG